MALLLRMGGVPARVATGFSTGATDSKTGEYIVRDFDAHSWVEVFYPGWGWYTYDPTPADSPARSQQTDTLSVKAATPTSEGPSAPASDRTSDPTAGGTAVVEETGATDLTPFLAGGGAVVLLVAGGVLLSWRRRRMLARSGDPEVEELRLALQRSGRATTTDLTLARVEKMLAGSDGALGYVRSLRVARYGGGTERPTPRQRRALRHELAAGLGIRGRLRALWALPPQSAELRDALRPRRSRSYT
jgi:protein-glutamine gamma-glutamyltransferase